MTACSPRGAISVVPLGSGVGTEHSIFVATTRQPQSNTDFGTLRTSRLQFAQYTVSVPPTHEDGAIEWPKGHPNPATDFVTTSVVPYADAMAFTDAMNIENKTGLRTAIVFVHGFNTSFAEGTYRLAQVAHDMGETNTMIHYSWAATQNLLEYTRDRDTVLFARDGLEQLLTDVTAQDFDQVILLAHSIGSSLMMETLRQVSLQSKRAVLEKIGGVILISPDIDSNVFETQLRRIDPLPKPFVVFGDQEDLALRVSGLLTGRDQRVGQLRSTERLKPYGIEFVDLTGIDDGGSFLKHSVALTSPTVLSLMRKFPAAQRKASPQDFEDFQNDINQAIR